MPTEYISDDDHILRYVKHALLRRDENDVLLGVLPQAFRLRPDEEYLSAWWIEYFKRESNPTQATIAQFKLGYKTRKGDRFARGNVGAIKEACASFGNKVRITREPFEGGDAHCGVRQFRDSNEELLDLLASTAWADLIEAH